MSRDNGLKPTAASSGFWSQLRANALLCYADGMTAPLSRLAALAFCLVLAACDDSGKPWHATDITGAMPKLEFRMVRANEREFRFARVPDCEVSAGRRRRRQSANPGIADLHLGRARRGREQQAGENKLKSPGAHVLPFPR